jgi:hypothetical protein
MNRVISTKYESKSTTYISAIAYEIHSISPFLNRNIMHPPCNTDKEVE